MQAKAAGQLILKRAHEAGFVPKADPAGAQTRHTVLHKGPNPYARRTECQPPACNPVALPHPHAAPCTLPLHIQASGYPARPFSSGRGTVKPRLALTTSPISTTMRGPSIRSTKVLASHLRHGQGGPRRIVLLRGLPTLLAVV